MPKRRDNNISLKNLFVVNAQLLVSVLVFKTVQLMEQITLNLNAVSVAQLPNGSAGALLTSVNHATSAKWTETMFQRRQRASYLSAMEQTVALSRSNTQKMEMSFHSDVLFAEIKLLT